MKFPFRIFANQNLGTQYDYTVFTGEWLHSKGTGQSPILPEINLTTGNVILKSAMVKTQEQIGDWEFGFVYNAQNKAPWSLNIPGIVSSTPTQLTFRESDGSLVIYTYDSTQKVYVSPSGGHSKITLTQNQSDQSWIQCDPKTGKQTQYDKNNKITAVYDARGLSMTYAYDDQGELQTITSAAGVYTIQKNNLVTTLQLTATGQTNSQTLGTWTFDASGRLESAAIPGKTQYLINYTYNGATNALTQISQSDGTSVNLTYTADDAAKIKKLQQGSAGPSYTFAYSENQSTITDALGFVTTATVNKQGCIINWEQSIDDKKTISTQCDYQDNGDIKSITKPNSAQTQLAFNSQGLITQKINPEGQITEYDYDDFDPETFSRIIKRELISGSGNTAVYATTRYVYQNTVNQSNGLTFRNLAFKISPSGCVTEYRYDTKGILESERTYLKNTYDLSGMSAKTALSLDKMQTWASTQPKNAITLTTYSENNRGQCTQVQRFTDINPDGTGINTLSASHDHYQNHTLWGSAQTHTQKMDVDSSNQDITASTEKTFDGLHRLTSHQNALGEKRSIVYNDIQKNTVITEPNDRTETTSWNDAGQISTITTAITHCSVTRTKSNTYDAGGRLTALQNIDGQITYQLFDALNRLRFTVSPEGRVTENYYDDVNHYHSVRNYYHTVTVTPPLTIDWLIQNLVKDATNDVLTFQVLDSSERLQFEIDGRGAVIEHQYDLLNREIRKIAYASPLSPDELTALEKGTFSRTPSSSDSIQVTFYDNDNHIIATQDPAGYITTYQRNPAGFLNDQYTYSTPCPIILNNTLTLPSTSANDYAKYVYTDAKGQTRFVVDDVNNANYITQHTFYPTGKIQTETKYANQATSLPSLTCDPTTLIPAPNSEDQVTTSEYDLLSRLTKQHLPAMRLKENTFDSMGNVITESMGDDASQLPSGASITTQTTAKRFDDWGQCIAEAPPLLYAKILANPNTADQIWETQSLRHTYDDATGLMIAKKDSVPDDGDINNPATTFYYMDKDRRIVLTVGPEGRTSETAWHPIFNLPLNKTRYATPIDTTGLSGGFINSTVQDLITQNSARDISDSFAYDGCGSEINHVDPDGFETQTAFNMFGQWETQYRCVNSTTPSLTVKRTFDLRHLLLTETESANGKSISTVNKTYNNCHGLCDTSTDSNGAVTQFSYEPRGVLSTSTDPLNRVTTYRHDAFERETLRSRRSGLGVQSIYHQGNRQLTINHVDITTPQYTVLNGTVEAQDAFGNVISHQDAIGNTTQFSFDLENHLEKKQDALNNIYENGYDLLGLLRSESYAQNAGLYKTNTAYLYSLHRERIVETQDRTGLNLATNYAWNAVAQRYQTTTPAGNVRKTVFNKRSLATEHHKIIDDKTSVITAQNYNGLQTSNALSHYTTTQSHTFQEHIISDDFGREQQRVVDPAGLQLTHAKTVDNANRVIATTDPKGQITYIVRDRVGNIRFEINSNGGVTEHCYNEYNKPVFTAQYITPVDVTKISVGMSEDKVTQLLSLSDYDRHTHYFYDLLNNERFRVNHAGAVVETRYDLNNQPIATIQYYTAITANKSTLDTNTLVTQCAGIRNKTKDKATYRILDALGQEVFVIGADGAVTQKMYYSTLHKANGEIKYATKVSDPESFSKLSIAQITAQLTPSSDDRKTHWIVDALNRLQFHVSPSGAVTRYDYVGDTNNREQITEFAQPITLSTTHYATLLTQLNALVPDPKTDNIETCAYDNAERIITRTNALGKSESFTYDGASRKSSHTTLSGHQWHYDYDGASRLWHEFSPETTVYAASIDSANVTGITVTPSTISIQKETDYDENSNVLNIISGVGLSDAHIVNFAYNALNLKNEDTWNNVPIDDNTQPTSLTVRPETLQSVTKSLIHGAHGAKLIAFDEAKNPTFYVYNAEGQLRYKINAQGYVVEYQRNPFGECECFIAYANALTINLTLYLAADPTTHSLLTSDIVAANIASIKDAAHDRSYHQTFDQNGKITQIQRDPVVCYTPNPNPSIAPTVALQTPTKQTAYNTFGEVIAINDNERQTLIWCDALGNEIATVDANGKAIVKTYDAFGRQTEEYRYAGVITPPQPGISFSALETLLLSIKDDSKDHHTLTPRDQIGRIKGIYHVGMTTQSAVAGQQAFADNPIATIGVTYTYTDDHKIKSITYPDGQVKINYYDERRYLVATAEVARTQVQPDGTKTLIRPITYYHVNIHGERVRTFKPESGCAIDLDPASEILPKPLSSSDQDRYHSFMRDPRGNVLVKQNPDNHLHQMTHTLTGKIARSYKPTTNATGDNSQITHCDEKRKSYDALDNVTLMAVYRDGKCMSQIAYQHDAFNLVAEGPNDGTFPVQHKFDQADRKWLTTDGKGGAVLIGHNTASLQTVEIESTTLTIDLSTTTYAELQTILQQKRDDVSNYEFTETLRDPGGRTNGFVEAGYLSDNTTVRPTSQLGLNNFDKKIQTVSPAGDTTTFERNKFDKISKQTDPAIEVMDEKGNTSTQSAETDFGYNTSGKKIGVKDANGHTELFARDEAEQVVSHTAGDGVPYFTNTLDAFGNTIKVTSASGNTWERLFNGTNGITQIIMPSGNVWNYALNENNFVIEETPPANSAMGITRYAQGIFGDMSARYLPVGEKHLYEHDRHHQELLHSAFDSNGNSSYAVLHQRDYFGKALGKTDGSGSTYQNKYYNNGMLYQELGLNVVNHGEMAIFDSTTGTFTKNTDSMPLKNITYNYLTQRRLSSIADNNSVKPQTLVKLFDIKRNCTSIIEKNAAGHLLRNTVMTFNARDWPVTHADINFSLHNYYDLVSNRRAMLATSHGITHNGYWTYDAADHVLVNDGQLINGVIQSVSSDANNWGYLPPSSQGNTFTYSNGLRNSQSWLTRRSMAWFSDAFIGHFGYDKNDQLSSVTVDGSEPTPSATSLPVTIQPISCLEVTRQSGNETDIRWLTTPNETVSNTTVRAVGTGNFIAPDSISVCANQTVARFKNLPQDISYNVVVVVTANNVVYQGSVPLPAPSCGFNYNEMINYTGDGFFNASYIDLGNNQKYILNQNTYNLNGVVTDYYAAQHNGQIVTHFSGFITGGFYASSESRYFNTMPSQSPIIDSLSYNLWAYDDWVIANTSGTRTDQYGKSNVISCPRYYDANGALGAVVNVHNPFNSNDHSFNTLFFDQSLSGYLLAEWSVLFNDSSSTNIPTYFYPDTKGHIVAECGMVSNPANQTEIALQITANPVQSFNVSNLLSQSVGVTIQPGDDWKTLSYRVFGDANYASILHAYSGVKLEPGQTINLTQTLNAYNKAHDYAPYQRLMDIVYNSINPALKTPEPPPPKPHHESIWDELIGAIVSVVVMVFVPEMAASVVFGSALSALTAGDLAFTYTIAGALADAASQGVAIAFDDQHGFSFKDMYENAIASGATAGIGKALGISELIHKEKFLKAFTETTALGLTVQLFQMGIGLRDKLDIKLIIEQAAAQLISGKINPDLSKDMPSFLVHSIDELANSTLNTAVTGQVDLANLAGSYLGDEAGDEADLLAKNMVQSHHATSIGKTSNPSHYSDHTHALQTAPKFNPSYDFDSGIGDLYTAYESGLQDDVGEMAASDYATAEASAHVAVEHHRAVKVQQTATQHATSSWENDLSETLYQHQNSLWARGIMGFAAAMNSNAMHVFVNGLNGFTRDAMHDVAGNYGTRYFDDLQNGTSTLSDTFGFVGTSAVGVGVGEIGGAALDLGVGFAGDALPEVGKIGSQLASITKNIAGFFKSPTAEKITINASSPSEIAWGYGNLSTRQAEMLDTLTKPGRFLQLHKSYISPTDLAALTAHTGDEFALFTLGSRRIVVRGMPRQLIFPELLENKLLSESWSWSAHTHPGISDKVLLSSGDDRATLGIFNQDRSLILNSAGRRSIFDNENDYAISNALNYESIFRKGY